MQATKYVTSQQVAELEKRTKEFLQTRANVDQFTFKELKNVDWLPNPEFANFISGIHQSLLLWDQGFWCRQYHDHLPPNITVVVEVHCQEDGGEPQWYWALEQTSYATPFGGKMDVTINYTAFLVSEHYSERGTASVEWTHNLPAA